MRQWKRLGAGLLAVMMLFAMLPTALAATTGTITLTIDSPTMMVNGTSKPIDDKGTKPVLEKGGYTMLPIRAVLESMGGTLTWDAKTRSMTMVKDNQTVQMTVGKTQATVDGKPANMVKAPYISKAGVTMVHIRALELFTGTKCTYDQATKQVTVTYTDNTQPIVTAKNYRIDLINKTGKDITGLRYCLAGTYAYNDTNALSGTLANNGTASFYISVPDNAINKVYDFYTEGTGGTKMYNGLNLNGVNAYTTVLLKNTDRPSFEQANDKTITVPTGSTELKFENKSSKDIEELYMSKTNSFSNATNLLATETVKSKGSTTLNIDLDGEKSWYFQAVTASGNQYSNKVTFGSATQKEATLTLSSSNRLSLNGSGDTELKFTNKANEDIVGIYMSTSKSDLDDLDDMTNLLSSDLSKNDSETIAFDLESDKTWYISVEFEDSKDLEKETLNFKYEDPASVEIRISKSKAELQNEKRQAGDGDLTVAFVNDSGQRIDAIFPYDEKDTSLDRDDFSESDDLLDGDRLDYDDYAIIEGLLDAEEYYFLVFYGSGRNDYGFVHADFSDASEYGVVYLKSFSSSSFSGEIYDDTDDEMVLMVYNDSGTSITDVYLKDTERNSEKISGSLGNGKAEFYVIDKERDFDEYDLTMEVRFDGDSSTYTYDWNDVDEDYCFVLITILDDRDDDADFEDIYDLA